MKLNKLFHHTFVCSRSFSFVPSRCHVHLLTFLFICSRPMSRSFAHVPFHVFPPTCHVRLLQSSNVKTPSRKRTVRYPRSFAHLRLNHTFVCSRYFTHVSCSQNHSLINPITQIQGSKPNDIKNRQKSILLSKRVLLFAQNPLKTMIFKSTR